MSEGFFLFIFREFQKTTKSKVSNLPLEFVNNFSLKTSNSKSFTMGKKESSSIP